MEKVKTQTTTMNERIVVYNEDNNGHFFLEREKSGKDHVEKM